MTRLLAALFLTLSGCGPVTPPTLPASPIPHVAKPLPDATGEPPIHYCHTECILMPPHGCLQAGD